MTVCPPVRERPEAIDPLVSKQQEPQPPGPQPPESQPPGPQPPEVLFKEARRRRRRRYAFASVAVVAVAGLTVGLVSSSALPPPAPPGQRPGPAPSGGYVVSASDGAAVRSVALPGFAPSAIVSLDGKVWLVGFERATPSTSAGAGPTRCAIEEVTPSSMRRVHRYALASCGDYVTSGGGDIYLAVITGVAPTNTEIVRVEQFDPATGRAIVMGPTVLTVSGSERAHCELAYASGSLWFWGAGSPGTQSSSLVQISPSTGTVERSIPSGLLPSPGLPRSVLTGQGRNLWLSGEGPGTHEVVDVLRPGHALPQTVTINGELVQWISPVDAGVWAYAYTFRTTPAAPATPRLTNSRLVEVGAGGHVTTVSSVTLAGTGVVGDGRWVFGSGVGGRCDRPLAIWQIDGSSASVRRLVSVRAPYRTTCIGATGLAAVGHDAFSFLANQGFPSRLFRVRAPTGLGA